MSFSVQGWWRCALALAVAVAVPAMAGAQETEPNDDFGSAQVVVGAPGGMLISAEMEFIPPVEVFAGSLEPGVVDSWSMAGLSAGAEYFAFIDNDLGNGTPDTMMRSLDEFGAQILIDDDSSPVGNGRGSGIISEVNSDGSLHFEVTGYLDEDFDGIDDEFLTPTVEEGDYNLIVLLHPYGDVDFYRITGLLPGSEWTAETTALDGADPLDTLLTEYDAAGDLVQQNDDIDFPGGIFLSALSGVVPASGEIILAASAFPDFENDGTHIQSGLYGLALTYTAVPEPGTLALCGIGALGMLFAARRRK